MVPFIEMARLMSVWLMRLRTAKLLVLLKVAVVPPSWKPIAPPPMALSVGVQSITLWPGLTLIVVVVGVVVIPAAPAPLVAKVPLPSRLCAAAGVAPTNMTVASASTEQLVRVRRDDETRLRIMISTGADGW